MSEVTILVNGRSYRMACDDGQEEHLEQLGARLDQAIGELREAFGEIGDQRLTVMAAILMTDRLQEAETRLRAVETELKGLRGSERQAAQRSEGAEAQLARALDRAAARIEELAARLNAAPAGDAPEDGQADADDRPA
jgi:cell division protein ZapA